jgi:GNAT superfamily N-acetyltransferase
LLVDHDLIRGFVHYSNSEVLGLFVDPEHRRKGYGSALFRFAIDRITIKSSLNAISFYERMGCKAVSMETVYRHNRDIYAQKMEIK